MPDSCICPGLGSVDRGLHNGDHEGMPEEKLSRYGGSLADLEDSVHVPAEAQVSEQAEAPAEAPISAEELDRQRLLGITGAGRLNVG